MNADKLLDYLKRQEMAIEALAKQLDEIQIEFNAQFDQFKARHDAALARVTELAAGRLEALPEPLRSAVEQAVPREREKIEERRDQIRDKYLPDRQKAADALLQQAQAEMEAVRTLNPQLDKREEGLKKLKGKLEQQLAALNDQIRSRSRGLGVVLNFVSIVKADQQRQRIVGRLEEINDSVRRVRREWETKQREAAQHQAELQQKWQLETIAVARLQAELDQLQGADQAGELALRRAVYQVLDALVTPSSSPDAELHAGLQEVIELNVQTDVYHQGLAAVGGLIGLLGGIGRGLEALEASVQGLGREQEMHSAHLKPLSFHLPAEVKEFHEQWAALDQRFADEKAIAAHPAEFASAVEPLVKTALSQASIEAMFDAMGSMIKTATAAW